MDWVLKQLDILQKRIQASTAPSSATSSVTFPFERPEQINDYVYQVHKPAGRPSIEIVFFHGLQLEGSKEAYLTTWVSEQGSELWVTWILKEFPDARILLVSYDAFAQRKDDQGLLDMYCTCENLVESLTEGKTPVGGDGCPVILVGHSIGGLVIKELSIALHSTISKLLPQDGKESVRNLLQNVKGLFYYACPHHGSRLADASSEFSKGPLFEGITTLNREAQRTNEDFRKLQLKYGWKTYGIGEGRPATLGKYKDFIVSEASARCDVDGFYTQDADHFNVCRPRSTSSSNFSLLSNFIAGVLEQHQDRCSPKMRIPSGVYGLEGRVNDIMDIFKKGARRVGIVGMGGIGKTTLARAVYDIISGGFEYTCFLREVKRSMAGNDDLEHLRSKIMKSLFYNGCKVNDHFFNWKTLEGKTVLIVLDDVDCEAQVQVMLESDGFSHRSCIMVTSRESRFLYAEDFECYFVKQLDEKDSKSIFCLNAFREEVAKSGYEYNVARFMHRCGGLPLALRLAGKYLYGQELAVWDEALAKLKHAKPLNGSEKDGLWSIMRMCYKSLAEEEQEMFLDIATCFHNQDLETVKRAWSLCGWASPVCGLKNLEDKGFVTIEDTITIEENMVPRESQIVRMHELLRDLGRSIACPNSRNVASHTRLCYDLSNPLPTTQLFSEENCQVKILLIHRSEDISIPSLSGLEELRILWLEDVSLCGPLSLLPTNLSYMKIIDSTLSIQSDGSHASSTEASPERKRRRRLQQLSALKRLEISACKLMEGSLDGLDQCQALEHLEIRSLSNWSAIPESLGELRALKDLRVVSCDELESIPDSFTGLVSLTHLEILDCQKIRAIPDSLGRLQALKHLVISCCCIRPTRKMLTQLRDLRHFETTSCLVWKDLLDWLGWLDDLQNLVIHRCRHHDYPVIDQLQFLKSLTRRSLLQGVGQVHLPMFDEDYVQILAWDSELLPSNFVGLGRARILLIKDCLKLKSLPDTLGYFQVLEDLKIVNCGNLKALPDTISELKALKSLSIISCDSLLALPNTIRNLQALTYLLISCGSSKAPPDNLQQLKVKGLRVEITLCQCGRDWGALWDTIGQLHALPTFVIHDCDCHALSTATDQLNFLDSLTRRGFLQAAGQVDQGFDLPIFHMEHVEIVDCKLEHFPSHFFGLGHASSLVLKNCWNVKVLPDSLGELRALREFKIQYCHSLTSLPDALGKLTELRYLWICGCSSLEALPDSLGELPALERLSVCWCPGLRALPDTIGELRALRELGIRSCGGLTSLPDALGKLTELRYLWICRCSSLEALPDSLGELPALETLSVYSCEGLRALPDTIGELRALRQLEIWSCGGLTSLPDALGKLTELRYLWICGCSSLEALPDSVGELPALETLSVDLCEGLRALPDTIGELRALRELKICSCGGLTSLPDALRKLTELRYLSILGCSSLEALPDSLGELPALERLSVCWCRRLRALPDTIGELRALRELEIKYCDGLTSLPDALGKLTELRYLSTEGCRSLEALPDSLAKLPAPHPHIPFKFSDQGSVGE